jgi:cysteine synthase A
MTQIYKNIIELIGGTPLVRLGNIEKLENLHARLLVKVESFNPGGSVKDRIALAMIEQAERDGILRSGGLIVEPTSGNTGIGLALVGVVKGYRVILTMPETMSVERRKLVAAYGAEIVLTPGAEGMKGAIAKAKEIVEENEGSFLPFQFENAANPAVHKAVTAEEIWVDTEGEVDVVVAGVGTGGTVSGISEGLKFHNPNIKAIAVEPAASAVLSGYASGPHKIQGIGAGFEPKNFHRETVDEILPVSDDDAIDGARLLAKNGILAGFSSGAALKAAVEVAKRPESVGKTIVAVLPDTGERYLSTVLFG